MESALASLRSERDGLGTTPPHDPAALAEWRIKEGRLSAAIRKQIGLLQALATQQLTLAIQQQPFVRARLRREWARERRARRRAAAVRSDITLSAALLEESPFGAPSATFPELRRKVLDDIFDATGVYGLSSVPDVSGPLLGAASFSSLEPGSTYCLVCPRGMPFFGARAQVKDGVVGWDPAVPLCHAPARSCSE